jgi:hypothetical protein
LRPEIKETLAMTKRVLLTLLIIFIVLSNTSAQDFYRQGFIITTNNDTLRGLINDREATRSSASVQFKESENSTPRTYSTTEIKAFATSRRVYYESHHFKYDGDLASTTETNLIPAGYFTSRSPEKWNTTDSFLEVIVKGKFSLFKYHDVNDRIHFLILDEGSTELEELMHRRFKSAGSTALNVNESYKQQLIIRLQSKCPRLESQIPSLPYREKNLAKIVTAMNECYGAVQEIPTVGVATNRKRSEPGIVVEAYLTDPDFIKTSGGFDAVQFGGGISYEVFSRKRPNKLSFYTELKAKNFSNEDTYHAKFTSFTQTGKLTYQTVKLTNMVRVYPTKISSLFFNIGVVYGVRFNTKIDGTAITDRDAKDGFEFGFAGGFGKKFNSIGISIEPRFELNVPDGQKSFGIIIGKQF